MAFERLATRVLGLLGLDLDFAVDLGRRPLDAITPTLSLGARPRPEQLDALRAHGVTHVVSCLDDRDRPRVVFLGDAFETLARHGWDALPAIRAIFGGEVPRVVQGVRR